MVALKNTGLNILSLEKITSANVSTFKFAGMWQEISSFFRETEHIRVDYYMYTAKM